MQLENRDVRTRPWAAAGRGIARHGDGEGSSMPGRIDLRPLLPHQAAAEMLMLARGQMNRAFRAHGLATPNPMLVTDPARFDFAELDDPAANGAGVARARHGDAFVVWTEEMPASLARPVLQVLRQALGQVPDANGVASAAVTMAHKFLLGRLQKDGGGAG